MPLVFVISPCLWSADVLPQKMSAAGSGSIKIINLLLSAILSLRKLNLSVGALVRVYFSQTAAGVAVQSEAVSEMTKQASCLG